MEQKVAELLMEVSGFFCPSHIRETVRSLINQEGFDVNKPVTIDYNHRSLLGFAVLRGHAFAVAELLKNPMLDVNWPISAGMKGSTALDQACGGNHHECVELLVKDARTDIHVKDASGNMVLEWTMRDGPKRGLRVLRCLFASFHRWFEDEIHYVLGKINTIAEGRNRMQINFDNVEFCLNYAVNPWSVIKKFRKELEWEIYTAVEYFLLVLLYLDGYFNLTSANPNQQSFFKIMKSLPIEIQMLICHRIADSPGMLIPSQLINNCLKIMVWHNKTFR